MDRHERMLVTFLAGELDEREHRAWDEHLVHCERCWRAVREDRLGRSAAARLTESAPPQLAERIRFATAMAAKTHRRRGTRQRRWVLAGGGALVAVVLALLALSWRPPLATPPDSAAVTAVVQRARTLPTPTYSATPTDAKTVPIGAPVTVNAGDATLRLSHYRVGGVEVIVAHSNRPFSMPAGSHAPAGGMAWTAVRGRVALYCPERGVLIAAPVPVTSLPRLADKLPL